MSNRKKSKNSSTNINVTTYSGFSRLRLISSLLKITLIMLFIAFPIIWLGISTNEIDRFFGILVTTLLIINIFAIIVIRILRHAYRV